LFGRAPPARAQRRSREGASAIQAAERFPAKAPQNVGVCVLSAAEAPQETLENRYNPPDLCPGADPRPASRDDLDVAFRIGSRVKLRAPSAFLPRHGLRVPALGVSGSYWWALRLSGAVFSRPSSSPISCHFEFRSHATMTSQQRYSSVIGVTFPRYSWRFVAMLRLGTLQQGEGRQLCGTRIGSRCLQCLGRVPRPCDGPLMRDDIIGYVEMVVRVEWPAQAKKSDRRQRQLAYLKKAETAVANRSQTLRRRRRQTCKALLLQSLTRLWDARTGEIAGLPRPPFQRSSGSGAPGAR